jgi:hypothetical protein
LVILAKNGSILTRSTGGILATCEPVPTGISITISDSYMSSCMRGLISAAVGDSYHYPNVEFVMLDESYINGVHELHAPESIQTKFSDSYARMTYKDTMYIYNGLYIYAIEYDGSFNYYPTPSVSPMFSLTLSWNHITDYFTIDISFRTSINPGAGCTDRCVFSGYAGNHWEITISNQDFIDQGQAVTGSGCGCIGITPLSTLGNISARLI